METLKYCKVREVKSPNRAHPEDAGIDFYVPTTIDVDTFNEKCKLTGDAPEYKLDDNGNVIEITIHPGESVLLPSGIKVNVPSGYMLQFTNKSGVASKKHLHVGACVTGNTLIETNIGKFSATTLTADFCDRNNILIKTQNIQSNTIEYQKCDGFRQVKISKCIKVTFDDGTFIEGDEDHQIYFDGKWIALKDL